MKYSKLIIILIFLFIFLIFTNCNDSEFNKLQKRISSKKQDNLNFIKYSKMNLEKYNAGFFSIEKPSNWNIVTAGSCSTFSFLIRDSKSSLNQVFYFGAVGPIYLSMQQKQIDGNYMRMGGYRIAWYEMPVVNPFTPENFLLKWNRIANTNIAKKFMIGLPQLKQINIISSKRVNTIIQGGTTKIIRALFVKNGKVGEGLFSITLAPTLPFTGGPGAGNGYGFMITGVTASKKYFKYMQNSLLKSIKSFYINNSYVQNCMRIQNQSYAAVLKAGNTLRESSDMIMNSWEKRNKSYDIMAEKRSDAILGKERLYNPDTDEVFEFNNGFYDNYNLNKNSYNLNNLVPIPKNNYKLWNTAPVNGYKHIKRENN